MHIGLDGLRRGLAREAANGSANKLLCTLLGRYEARKGISRLRAEGTPRVYQISPASSTKLQIRGHSPLTNSDPNAPRNTRQRRPIMPPRLLRHPKEGKEPQRIRNRHPQPELEHLHKPLAPYPRSQRIRIDPTEPRMQVAQAAPPVHALRPQVRDHDPHRERHRHDRAEHREAHQAEVPPEAQVRVRVAHERAELGPAQHEGAEGEDAVRDRDEADGDRPGEVEQVGEEGVWVLFDAPDALEDVVPVPLVEPVCARGRPVVNMACTQAQKKTRERHVQRATPMIGIPSPIARSIRMLRRFSSRLIDTVLTLAMQYSRRLITSEAQDTPKLAAM